MSNQKSRKLETGNSGISWTNIAMAAYIMGNIEPSEAAAPEGVNPDDHLRQIIAGEFQVDEAKIKHMTEQLTQAVQRGDLSTLTWTRDDYRAWIVGIALSACRYDVIHQILFDDEN